MQPDSQKIEFIAKTCHEINRAYCASIGDHSHLPWEMTPENVKASVRSGVLNVAINPGMQPGETHQSWLEFKKQDGWVYGPEKDFEKKTHPCMVPYEELPQADKTKDYIFLATVRQLM